MLPIFAAALTLLLSCSSTNLHAAGNYPDHWWQNIPRDSTTPEWEVLPQEAGPGEVILSKRNELGILSNFAPTPVVIDSKRYPSLEGFWQAMKYPESTVDGDKDPRADFTGVTWAFTRQQVEQMSSFEAKKAGDLGSTNMKKMGINWVSYQGVKMPYKVQEKGPHYKLIYRAMEEKLKQNPEVLKILLSTGDLVLRPDHQVPADNPPAWQYYTIWMELRAKYQGQAK